METVTDHSLPPVRGSQDEDTPAYAPHPRTLGWLGTAALAMGGSNQSLFLIGGAVGLVATQGSAAVPLLVLGLLLGWLALPGWIELVLMWPQRVGGIAATCAEAFRPLSPVLANLTGVCYWWGWVPTCGLTAFLSAKAINAWFLPEIPAKPLAVAIILGFLTINLCGVRWAVRLALPIAAVSAALAFLSGIVPIVSGAVDWHRATDYRLLTPFSGWFGGLTSAMAGLYLIGFAAPAFEQAACHVGETIDPARNVPRAMYASALMATLYFLVLPVVWLGVLGPGGLTGELQDVLGPTFAPLLGPTARAAAIGFMVFNMFHGSLAPLAGAARTLAQLAEDGLLPRLFGRRNRRDAPWVATTLTAGMAILFLLTDDPPWVIAAANLCYLIGICLPSVAVWLLRRSDPGRARPYRASRWALNLGVLAAGVWGVSTVFGFQQYGLPAVIAGVVLAYAGSALYAWRLWEDRRRTGVAALTRSLHLKLTGTMIAVLTLDAVGYLLAVQAVDPTALVLRVVLEDIFVAVALLTITVGLVLPGTITHLAEQLSRAAQQLATGTMTDFSRAMGALAAGDLDAAHARVSTPPVVVTARDELGAMATSFNTLRAEIARSVVGLDGAREGLRAARGALTASNTQLLAEIGERTAFEARLHHQAFHDALTKLPNRALFFERLAHALTRLGRQGGAVAVLFLDLDRFKTVNDSLGHQVGDRLLVAVGERLQGLIRGSDTLARLGGDEFTILLEQVGDAGEAVRLAERIAGALQRPFLVDGREIVAETSVGIVLSTPALDSPTELLRAADVALYRAKARGKGLYELFDPTMNARALERLELEGDLRQALARGQLALHYQPQVDLATGTLHGVEALVRWHHPRRGPVPPADFIPLAEETGLIRPIGRWVLTEACRQAREWQERHPGAAALVISVNLAAPEFQQPHLVGDIGQILAQTGLPPHLLELEITESVVMDDVASAMTALRQLKGLGVRLAIDDFGTGYSSLSYLKRFPVDTLKIDKSFIDGLVTDPEETAIVQAVISLAHTLGLSVTAEGVETTEQAARLRQLGCERAQGYLFARPLAADGIEPLLDGGMPPHAMGHCTCGTPPHAITAAVSPRP